MNAGQVQTLNVPFHMNPAKVDVIQLAHGAGLCLPRYETAGAAGCDLLAAIETPIELAPGARHLVPTAIALSLPPGYEGQLRPRSGLAMRHGITVLNAPGTIDADYRGEIKVLLINLGHDPFSITRGARIAQLVIAPVTRIALTPVDHLDSTARGTGGFGSTGS